MRIVSISDTHGLHARMAHPVPDGDVLVVAGDCTNNGSVVDLLKFGAWIAGQPHAHKIVVAGNHDWCFEKRSRGCAELLEQAGVQYLEDDDLIIDDVAFYGSPWQPEFCQWAFNLPRGKELKAKWDMIPEYTDVLITHGPPKGVLDIAPRADKVGSAELRIAVERVCPKLHIFGHIHDSHGTHRISPTTFVNASICTESYEPTNKPIVSDI